MGVLRNAGYNVLTWDPRGFGQSGGQVEVDSPDYEARDASALIDLLAQQPEAQLDKAGDPRVGMNGSSYGGGIQWITAARDARVDVITPNISWNSLTTSLYKDGSLKAGWGVVLCGLGIAASLPGGLLNPDGIELSRLDPHMLNTCVNGIASGYVAAGRPGLVRGPRPGHPAVQGQDPHPHHAGHARTRCSRSRRRSATTRRCAAAGCPPRWSGSAAATACA